MTHPRPPGTLPALLTAVTLAACQAPPPEAPPGDQATPPTAEAPPPDQTTPPTATPAPDPALEESVFHLGGALPWGEPSGGTRVLPLYGSATAQGRAFAFRLEVQPGFEMGPHTHPITEHLTVLSGEFWVGIGETMDRDAATAYGPGSYLAIAAGVPAYMWADEETVVQVHGVGPLTTDFIAPPEA